MKCKGIAGRRRIAAGGKNGPAWQFLQGRGTSFARYAARYAGAAPAARAAGVRFIACDS
ncbi:MAG: hypothetical protein Kow00114_41440 [Kiloniellaceae bacterium]